MSPEDDPEARIRELERPLAETARASELDATQRPGAHPYSTFQPGQVPPPTFGYDTSFPGASSGKSSGNRGWLIVAMLFTVGTLAIVGGIAAFAANRLSNSGVVVVSPRPRSSPVAEPPQVGQRNLAPTEIQKPGAESMPPNQTPGNNLSVVGINENRTIACTGGTVTVSGVSNTVVITGHCASLIVSGFENTVTVHAADAIEASGLNNNVTYQSGSPKITKSGVSNSVEPS